MLLVKLGKTAHPSHSNARRYKVLLGGHTQCAAKLIEWHGHPDAELFVQASGLAGSKLRAAWPAAPGLHTAASRCLQCTVVSVHFNVALLSHPREPALQRNSC